MVNGGEPGCSCTYQAIQVTTVQGEHVGTTLVPEPSPTCPVHR